MFQPSSTACSLCGVFAHRLTDSMQFVNSSVPRFFLRGDYVGGYLASKCTKLRNVSAVLRF